MKFKKWLIQVPTGMMGYGTIKTIDTLYFREDATAPEIHKYLDEYVGGYPLNFIVTPAVPDEPMK